MNVIKDKIKELLDLPVDLIEPPKFDMGDFCFSCFELAKKEKNNPVEVAKKLQVEIQDKELDAIDKVVVAGPYVNLFVNPQFVAKLILSEAQQENFGKGNLGKGKKWLVEFGCPNPMKVFHLGHLKNLITGESVARILDNAGYKVIRVNYQGDVGLHQAKAMWAIMKGDLNNQKEASLEGKVEFLGKMYAKGAKAYEENEEAKQEILKMNEKIYEQDKTVLDVYNQARQWSLEYFDSIYKKLDTHFDKLYFESDMFKRGLEIVKDNLTKGIFKESQGATIFAGSEYNLHDRVFVNSKGYPTYEAKDLALAENHIKDYDPDKIIHVVGKDQVDYFKVVFTAMDQIWPGIKEKEFHLVGGYLQLKGEQKMSSRSGNVIAGDELILQTENQVREIMSDRDLENKDEVIRKITGAVLKYAMLKSNVSQDVGFDMKSSVSLSGDSGPYLLYIVARINSILNKVNDSQINGIFSKIFKNSSFTIPETIDVAEKNLLLKLAEYPDITSVAAQNLDPSKISQYLFSLAQQFNSFYDNCPILQSEDKHIRLFRLQIVRVVVKIMKSGLDLLGVSPVEKM